MSIEINDYNVFVFWLCTINPETTITHFDRAALFYFIIPN